MTKPPRGARRPSAGLDPRRRSKDNSVRKAIDPQASAMMRRGREGVKTQSPRLGKAPRWHFFAVFLRLFRTVFVAPLFPAFVPRLVQRGVSRATSRGRAPARAGVGQGHRGYVDAFAPHMSHPHRVAVTETWLRASTEADARETRCSPLFSAAFLRCFPMRALLPAPSVLEPRYGRAC
jgi:hypothetical protein